MNNQLAAADAIYGTAYAKWLELRGEGAPAFPDARAADALVDAIIAYLRTASSAGEPTQ